MGHGVNRYSRNRRAPGAGAAYSPEAQDESRTNRHQETTEKHHVIPGTCPHVAIPEDMSFSITGFPSTKTTTKTLSLGLLRGERSTEKA